MAIKTCCFIEDDNITWSYIQTHTAYLFGANHLRALQSIPCCPLNKTRHKIIMQTSIKRLRIPHSQTSEALFESREVWKQSPGSVINGLRLSQTHLPFL